MSADWYSGNAADESDDYRGWLAGHFVDPARGPVRQTTNLEIKWEPIRQGKSRRNGMGVRSGLRSSSLLMARFRVDLSAGSVTLERQGDYLTWGPGIDPSWQAEDDSVVITVRWPSIP